MSETREQFRNRLYLTYEKARGAYAQKVIESTEGDEYQIDLEEMFRDGHEAVYAQALRDLRDEWESISGGDTEVYPQAIVELFARARGIDLGVDTDSGPPTPPLPRKTIDQHAQDDMLGRLERRIKDGRKLIEDRRAAGIDVTQLETFLVDLQHQYDQLSEVKR